MDKRFTKSLLMTALITGSVMWGGTAAFAEENVGEFSLDTMVVTATRYEKKDVDIAASTEVFDQERLQETGATNLFDALQYAVGVELHQYGPSGGSMGNMTSKIVMRGNSNGTLVMVNGIPLNTRATYDLTDIPVENIEKVEIVRGGGSVLYGSEATGGVINIITKKKRNNFVKAAVGNYGQQEYSGSFQAAKLGFGYKYTKRGTTEHIASDGKSWKGPENNNFDLSYQFNDRLSLSASHNDSKYHFITQGRSAKDTEQNVKRNNIQLTYDDNSFKATAYYVDRNREKDALTISNGRHSIDEENNKNFGLDLQKLWSISKNDKFLVGGNYKVEQYSPADGSTMQSRNNFSAYTSYEKVFDDKNTVSLSARESWTTGAPNDYNNTNFSGQVQYVHKLSDGFNVYASIGQSYKMPDLHQIAKKQPGADLKPQTGLHYEMGLKKDIDEHRAARIAVFTYRIKDNITADPDGNGGFIYTNEDLKNTGIEAEYRLDTKKGIGYNLSVAFGNPKTRTTEGGISRGWKEGYSKVDFKAGLTYKMEKFKAALNASYLADRTLSGNETKPSLVTNFNAEYEALKNGSIFLTINNILDRREDAAYVSTNGTSYYYTPINFMVGLKYSF